MFVRFMRSLGSRTFGSKTLQITNYSTCNNNQFSPVCIDVPWGKVEGKLWGSTNKQPILAIHGWQDNAATFDRLAPLLKNSSILAIDLPGHGFSDWIPRGIPYNEDICVETIRSIVKYFNWDKVKLLGHSMGGILCYNYARLYPELTQFVVSIDSLTFIPYDLTKHSKKKAIAIDKLINFEQKISNDPPSYSEEVLLQKWIDAITFSELDFSTMKILMTRGAKQKNDGTYYFTRDYRLNIEGFNTCYTLDNIKEISALITCPYLVIRATKSPFYISKHYWNNAIDVMKNTSSDFQIIDVEGSHHLHLRQVESVAKVVLPFFEKYDV